MSRMALGLCYDGSPWHGWQTQPSGKTVQDQLEQALSQFLAQPTSVICAGRTDTGVHALNQVVHLDTGAERSSEAWVRGLNALLPHSISVQWAKAVDDNFHARFSARKRTYFYVLRHDRVRSPLLHGKVGWEFRELDIDAMRQAARYLVGTHDFSSFRSAECQAKSPVRELNMLRIHQGAGFLLFQFEANAFLHHMVRNLMGALLYVGRGRLNADELPALMVRKDRKYAPPTFAPDGLYLAQVQYEHNDAIPLFDPFQLLQRHLGLLSLTLS
ncbi:tRNA pseudouridine(38-40) synthase TruA [Paenalcaligenes niemegkensis]|uniref:tRNA pseudouridine(38-40) synthase TruA n=1 Tax=Paenalcaligenes niemegkensis TaxID=2895469 RepID=UPI001EE7B78E|nr:tRNA pseudouridine(38-40) synthase TruA [Paenalcaligenes niemegkensis]MCQ9616225.1 tRNA pseudouridine(38-40) synthase TruA [Paenalcaligenes niemegkensis]